jgi:hypothetical protein
MFPSRCPAREGLCDASDSDVGLAAASQLPSLSCSSQLVRRASTMVEDFRRATAEVSDMTIDHEPSQKRIGGKVLSIGLQRCRTIPLDARH